MDDTQPLYAVRFPDGSVSLYVDEEYAMERGVDPAKLVRVDVPRQLYISGTVQEVREFVANYIEAMPRGSA